MGPTELPECLALDAYRLDQDWTWAELAKAMERAKVPINARTLHYLLKRAPADARMTDRTLYKIRKFLNGLSRAERQRVIRARKVTRASVGAR
jgi:hypothetical protein